MHGKMARESYNSEGVVTAGMHPEHSQLQLQWDSAWDSRCEYKLLSTAQTTLLSEQQWQEEHSSALSIVTMGMETG